jgi:NAD(P)-dependent dehydrogenase (short-subunit alcohol dehydrogenase family)
MTSTPLENQVIVITGASSGIGRATARAAAQRGAKLVIAARGSEALDTTRAELEATGASVIAVPTDVADAAQVEALATRAMEHFGRIDTWVNDASVSIYGNAVDVEPTEYRRVIEVNLLGTIYGSIAAVKRMRNSGGTLINVGSALSERAAPLQSAYAAAKHGVKGFTDALRVELEHDKVPVRVTLIKPASIDTPFFRHAATRMGVAPKPMPPVYAPDIVVDAILYAATHRVRDLSVGGGAAGLATLERVWPRLADLQLKLAGFVTQRSDVPAPAADGNLYAGSRGPGTVRGGYRGRRFSLYTHYQLHPRLRRAVQGTVALTGAVLAFRRSSRNGQKAD